MNYSRENDSTQREHIKISNAQGKFDNMLKTTSADALRRFKTKPYSVTAYTVGGIKKHAIYG